MREKNEKRIESIPPESGEAALFQSKELETLKTKEAIYSILRGTGISLNQGIDIAEVLTTQSKSSGVPISLILSVMKKESQFTPYIGAAALGRVPVAGSLDPGKQGDVVILENPSYRFIPYHIGVSTVEKVIKRGVPVFDKLKQGGVRC